MTVYDIISKLANAIYQRRTNPATTDDYTTYDDAQTDWIMAERAYNFFRDCTRPHDFFWEHDRDEFEWLYPLYLQLTSQLSPEERLRECGY